MKSILEAYPQITNVRINYVENEDDFGISPNGDSLMREDCIGTLGTLLAEVAGGGTATTTKVTDVIGETSAANLKYKLGGADLAMPGYGDSASGFTTLELGEAITVTSAQTHIVVVEADSSGVTATSAVMQVVTGS